MLIWLILGILLVILTICLGIAIIHESDEKIGVIISYVGFIIGLLLIIGYINSRPRAIEYSFITDVDDNTNYSGAIKEYTFADGTPFGIKEEE